MQVKRWSIFVVGDTDPEINMELLFLRSWTKNGAQKKLNAIFELRNKENANHFTHLELRHKGKHVNDL